MLSLSTETTSVLARCFVPCRQGAVHMFRETFPPTVGEHEAV